MLEDKINSSHKVIVDHLRSSAFLIADGILPENEGRGYILRRIIRRAVRHVHKLINNPNNTLLHKLVPCLIEEMGDSYPELIKAKNLIIDVLKTEEKKFNKTLDTGIEILKKEIKSDCKIFSGKVAFKLYDTYGFPLDLTKDILREKDIAVDIDEFNKEMEKQKQKARSNWVGSGEQRVNDCYFELEEKYGKTKFVGYESYKDKCSILSILKDGVEVKEINNNDRDCKNIEIILDKTPFYATSGGQNGDDGNLVIVDEDIANTDYYKLQNVIDICETKKMANNLFIHRVSDIRGSFKIGDNITAIVNHITRELKTQNHSATHILHYVLKQILGDKVIQKGSNIDYKYFTFDFNYSKPIEKKVLHEIEHEVNRYIRQNKIVQQEIMPIKEAQDLGALSLFGEKYEDIVRVISIGKNFNKNASIELCGGTHVHSTGNIGMFKIISEKGIASGIRRIEARTGYYALDYCIQMEERLKYLYQKIKSANQDNSYQLEDEDNCFISYKKGFIDSSSFINEVCPIVSALELAKQDQSLKIFSSEIDKVIDENKRLMKENKMLKKNQLLKELEFNFSKIGNLNLGYQIYNNINSNELKEIANYLKSKKEYKENYIFLLFSDIDNKILVTLFISNNLTNKIKANELIKEVIIDIDGKGGGGREDFAMGGGVNKNAINKAVTNLEKFLKTII